MKCKNEVCIVCAQLTEHDEEQCEGFQPAAASAGYARPRTRGELRDLLLAGVPCEVVSMVAEITVIMLTGWLGVENIKVRPSQNEGWSIFEA